MPFGDIDSGTRVCGRSSNSGWFNLSCNAIADQKYSGLSRNAVLVFNLSWTPNAIWQKMHELITSPALMNCAGKTASIQTSFERKASQNVLGWARFNFIILSLTEVLVNMLIFDKSKQPDCLTYRWRPPYYLCKHFLFHRILFTLFQIAFIKIQLCLMRMWDVTSFSVI